MERQIRAQYTADYKAQAVSLAETLGPTKTARKLAIPLKTLANGVRLSREGSGFVHDGKHRPASELEAWWCPGPDSNRHGRSRGILSPLRLPFRHPGIFLIPSVPIPSPLDALFAVKAVT